MLEVNDFDAVRISLASPEQIRSWSYGEVTKPETMNYRTLKPERDGLFCERIFGPIKDFECSCGKYRRIRYKGVICDKCGVEVARSKVRRERMGHIDLASPVAHIWFAKGIPSRLGLLLDMSPRNLERVLYFSHFVVTGVNDAVRDEKIAEIEAASAERFAAREAEVEAGITEMTEATVEDVNLIRRNLLEEKTKLEDETEEMVQPLRDLVVKQLMTEIACQDMQDRFGDAFEAEMGADAILSLVRKVDLDALRNHLVEENQQSSGQRRRKLSKQLRLVEALRRSSNKPDWMVLTVLPVLPPDLRPMIQLDGGRFATSDLNDLYRRVINRNNRLRHLLDMGAPEIIIRNEKRMLQEAVDSLIDNGRRGRAVSVSGNHQLKSLSDMLRGKHGRFRQNLLGKRVDYSGRSVIVVGPELELHQCGLPRRMALELFKPFVMSRLVAQGLAHNIKSARRLVEKARPEVYDILEDVVHHRPVLLNRAPTLHRLSIQAFEVVLIDGSALQLHPLVCSAFNADFDGDQMAVHVPLSKAAVHEARTMMLSTRNMLLPSSGEPIVTPTLDMVLGCYYLTGLREDAKGQGRLFGSYDDARLAYDLGEIDLGAEIEVREPDGSGARIKTTIGRIIFNAVLPPEIGFQNKVVDKSGLKSIVSQCWRTLSNEDAASVLDRIKELGFHYATVSGTTISASDIKVPTNKPQLLAEAEKRVKQITSQFQRGLITEDERYAGVVEAWMETTDRITEAISDNFDRYGGVYTMAKSGAKGNISQIRQMAGMRGLMTNPSGRIIDFPIKASLREGLGVLEYFISTHGARKGLADTALRTSSSGYLTRRLIDVAQDLIVLDEDCGTVDGIWMTVPDEKDLLPPLAERIVDRLAAAEVRHPETGELLLEVNQEIDEAKAAEIAAAGVTRVMVRSALTCQSRHGVCRACYGRDLARAEMVNMNTAVGIIAAQSIGEPGTQLTLRTFHTGGVVGIDITTGLPRVEELFEARPPRNEAIISEIDGEVTLAEDETGARIKVASTETITDEYPLPSGYKALVKSGQWIESGELLAQPTKAKKAADRELVPLDNEQLIARVSGKVRVTKDSITLEYRDIEEREYPVPTLSFVRVRDGAQVHAGQQLTEGSINPRHILHIMGREAVQQYLVDEVQRVYRSQGVNINDKHIEVIARQMLTKVTIDASGDTELVPGEIVARYNYEDINAKVLAEGGEPATAHTVLLGITRASLNTDSWLAAASFQETTRVLADAAVQGKVDHLIRLKENVIIGRLIPARLQNMPVDEPELLPEAMVTLLDREYVAELDLSEETLALLAKAEAVVEIENWPLPDDDAEDSFADILEADDSDDAEDDAAGADDNGDDDAFAADAGEDTAEDTLEPDAAAEDAVDEDADEDATEEDA